MNVCSNDCVKKDTLEKFIPGSRIKPLQLCIPERLKTA